MKPGKHRSNDDEAEQPNVAPQTPTGDDARKDPEKLKENRDKLGVGEDHQTPDMKKHRRGTFP